MHERNERQLAHPWLLARQRSQLDLPPGAEAPPHSARIALEAAFADPGTSPPPDTRSADSNGVHAEARTAAATPAVVVKRKRVFAPPDAPPGGGPEDLPEHDSAEDDRAPRIFRVPPASLPTGAAAPESTVSPPAAALDGMDVELPPIPVTAARRPRRRASPVIVTMHAAPPQDAAEPVPPRETEDEASALSERLAALDATFARIQDARDFRLPNPSGPSRRRRGSHGYAALLAEIERLQAVAEAQAKREAEAARAVSWIKRAIADYGLTRRDLGI